MRSSLISVSALVIALLVVPTAQAATAGVGKSSKKIAADEARIRPPQVLEVGDSMIGFQGAQGSNFKGASVMGVRFERMIRPNLGLNLQLNYATYSTTYDLNGFKGKYEYKAVTPVIAANVHGDVFKVRNLDTFVTLGVAHTFLSNQWKSNVDVPGGFKPANGTAKGDTTYFIAYLTARYFVDSNFAVSASIGSGLGALGLGIDYLF